jgi:hypothetical protein
VIWDGPWKIFGQFRWAANFFVCCTVGPPNKNPCNYILHKDINNKSKQNYPNYQMQMMLLKHTLFYTTTRSGRITANTTKWRAAQYRNW